MRDCGVWCNKRRRCQWTGGMISIKRGPDKRQDERGIGDICNSDAATQQTTPKKEGKEVLVISVGGDGMTAQGVDSNEADDPETMTMQKL